MSHSKQIREYELSDDGIHFTAAGYELIAEKLVELLSASAANAR